MRRRLVAAALALALPACTVGVRRADPSPSRSPRPVASVSLPSCPASYAEPDPRRPKVTLAFDVDESYTTVTGTEKVVFTPDRPVSELVFRLWLNGPAPVANGGRIEVTRASLPMSFEPGGAGRGTQGTLLRLALPAVSPAGRAITADLAFTMTLPRADVDRWGHTAYTAWWASAHPMLAWVRGAGWHTTPAVGLLGETAANETAAYDVTVDAPFGDTVLGIGLAPAPSVTGAGKQRWRFVNGTARDAAVTVGPFATRDYSFDGVPVRIAASAELVEEDAADQVLGPVAELARQAMRRFVATFGPFPYPSLTIVAIEPVLGAGVEYPGFIWVGSRRYDVVVPHEVAHEWFYGLVGDDQARDPWLDEAFASYAEALVDPRSAERFLELAGSDGDVGRPMSYWDAHDDDYGRVVYAKGAGTLLAARAEVGEETFDALLRCYVNVHAHRIATPEDVRAAFAPAPAVVDLLEEAGALPR